MSEVRRMDAEADSVRLTAQEYEDMVARQGISKYDELYLSGSFNFEKQDIEDIIRYSILPSRQIQMPSISNDSKAVKDKLDLDPYNMPLIKQLGMKYGKEDQWDKCANVMVRGWKRASEFPEAEERFSFLLKLSEASYRNSKFKQAHAIFMDIEEPQDPYELKAYRLLAIQLYSKLNDAPKSLAIFSKLIDTEDFEVAIKLFAATAISLKKVGAFEASKNAIANKVRSGANYHMDQSRLKTVEGWAIMASNEDKTKVSIFDGLTEGRPSKELIKVVVVIVAVHLLILFYWWEQKKASRG